MILSEKLILLQQISKAPSRAGFSELIGVSSSTLRRIEESGLASPRVLERIAGVFQDVTADILRDDALDLPLGVKLSLSRAEDQRELIGDHQGAQLGRYLDRLGRGARAELARVLGVSRTQVNSYESTVNFRPEVKRLILDALKVEEGVVFTRRSLLQMPGTLPNVSLQGLLLIRAVDRIVTPDNLLTQQLMFSPALLPERTFYVNSGVLTTTPAELQLALAVEVLDTDQMAPTFRIGAVVLAIRRDEYTWPQLSGNVVMQSADRLNVRRIYRNELSTANLVEFGPADRTQGGSITLRRDDIQALFTITHILLSPA